MNPRVAAAIAFVVSRLFYRVVFEVRLDSSPVHYFLQFLDPWYLEHDLARSVLSLHHQAPLLNLVLGVALKCFGRHAFVALDVGFIALGLWATVSLADVFSRLGLKPIVAAVGAGLLACSPTTVVYESWLFYPHVVASLLIVAASLLLAWVEAPTVLRGLGFFAVLAAIGLTRSTFGPLWFAVVAGALLLLAPVPRRVILKAAAVPLVVLLLHAAKTPLYVGHGYGAAMLWPNLAKKIYVTLPRKEQRRLVRKKVVSQAMKFEAFTDLDGMTPVCIEHEPTGIPALDEAHAPTGRVNANALEYALIAERYYKHDALLLLKKYPNEYAKATFAALSSLPRVATVDSTLPRSPNLKKLSAPNDAVMWLALSPAGGFSPVVFGGLLLGLGACVGSLVGRRAREQPGRRALAAFALLTILYTTAVCVLVSWGDFPRYRYEVDGLYWIFSVLGAAVIARKIARVWRRPAVSMGAERR